MLGPPVCMPCRRIMDFDEKRKGSHWWCSECGQEDKESPAVKHLLCLGGVKVRWPNGDPYEPRDWV